MNHHSLSVSPYAPFMHEIRVELDHGISIHAEVGGNPKHPCIVLIMGLGVQLIDWPASFCKYLIDQGFYVVRFDNRDIGLSSKISNLSSQQNILNLMIRFKIGMPSQFSPSYTLEDMADDTANLMKKLNIEHYSVIGASMGGMIAQILSAKYPHNVLKLGLLFTSNNQPFLPAPGLRQLKMFFGQAKSDQKNDIIQHRIEVSKIIGSPDCINTIELRKIAEIAYDRCYSPDGVLRQLLAILCTGSLTTWDQKITQHTLVVHGQRDRLLSARHGKAVAKSIQNSRFELILGMGHDIPEEYVPQLGALFAHHFKS